MLSISTKFIFFGHSCNQVMSNGYYLLQASIIVWYLFCYQIQSSRMDECNPDIRYVLFCYLDTVIPTCYGNATF